jgi:hypothetical protein
VNRPRRRPDSAIQRLFDLQHQPPHGSPSHRDKIGAPPERGAPKSDPRDHERQRCSDGSMSHAGGRLALALDSFPCSLFDCCKSQTSGASQAEPGDFLLIIDSRTISVEAAESRLSGE